MKNSSDKYLLENKVFTRVMAAVLGLFGLTLFSITAGLWQLLSGAVIFFALVYGSLLFFVAQYVWRIQTEMNARLRVIAYGLCSAGLFGAIVFLLSTPPAWQSIPVYHPKLISCYSMLLAAAVFARKAWVRR